MTTGLNGTETGSWLRFDPVTVTHFVTGGALSTDQQLDELALVERTYWAWLENLAIEQDWRDNGIQAMVWCSPNMAALIKLVLADSIQRSPPAMPSTSFWTRAHTKYWSTQIPDVQPNSASTRVCAYYSLGSNLAQASLLSASINQFDYLYLYSAVVHNGPVTSALQLPDINALNVLSAVQTALASRPSTRLMLSVGGWNDGDDTQFVTLTSDQTRISSFCVTAVATCQSMGFAGIDLDWQYPDTAQKRLSYLNLLNALSAALHGAGLLLSTTVTGIDSYGTATPVLIQPDDSEKSINVLDTYPVQVPNPIDLVDFLNVQAYDMEDGKQTFHDTQISVDYWARAFSNLSKINVGIPCYAKDGTAFRTVVANNGAPSAQTDNAGGKFYNGVTTVGAKVQYLVDHRVGGTYFIDPLQDVYFGEAPTQSLVNKAITLVASEVSPPTAYFDQFCLQGAVQLITGPCTLPGGLTDAIFIVVPQTSEYTRIIRPLVDSILPLV